MTITATNLHKSFGDVHAVNGLSFTVNDGELFGLLGPNGSGKTTTVKMLLGLLDPDDGEARIGEVDPADDSREAKSRIGYVSEESILYRSMTPREVYELVASVRRMEPETADARLAQLIEGFEAAESLDSIIATLSLGNRQKVQIIAALLHRPPILILDEPFSGLDAKSVRIFKEILTLHAERGGSVLFSTHILEIADDLCDRIAIINNGRLVAQGTPQELREKSEAAGASLEEVFLRLTEQDQSVSDIVSRLRASEG